MFQVWDRVLADAEIPVRMASPLDIKVVAKIESELDVLALQFVDDGTVIDAAYRDALAVVFIEQLPAFFLDCRDAHGLDAKHALSDHEVRQSLLVQRIDLHQDDVFGI